MEGTFLYMDNKLHTPVGVRDILPEEFAFKREVVSKIEDVFGRYGYKQISSPMLEYTEVFEQAGVVSNNMYRFIDRDGAVLGLRSDMTPPIARIAATKYNEADLPLRFSYTENSFINRESFQGKLHEFTQSGVELIGVNSIDADAEALCVAINALVAAGLKTFKIQIGHVDFLRGILEESSLSESDTSALKALILSRNFADASAFVAEKDTGAHIKELFKSLIILGGGIEDLDAVSRLVKNPLSLRALDELKAMSALLSEIGLSEFVSFDLNMVGNLDYYTGLIFRGHTPGTGFSILDGGRYDGLPSRFGKPYPAVGFALRINHIVGALQATPVTFADTLLAYDTDMRAKALLTGDELRMRGLYVENSLISGGFEENINHARSRKLKGVIYFSSNGQIRLYDIDEDKEVIAWNI